MKFLGHPLHVIMIHFPSAMFPMDLLCSILAIYFIDAHFLFTSYFLMLSGVFFGFLAIITGVADLIKTTNDRPTLVKKILIHGGINLTVIMGYSILAYRVYLNYPTLETDNISIIFVKTFLVIFMLIGNYIGGSLILKDKIGIA